MVFGCSKMWLPFYSCLNLVVLMVCTSLIISWGPAYYARWPRELQRASGARGSTRWMTLGEAGRFASLSPRRIRSLLNVTLIACWNMLDGCSSVEVNWSRRTTCSKVAKVQSLDGQKYLIVQCNCVVQNAADSLCAAGGSWNGHWTTIGMEMQGCHTYIHHIPSCIRLPEKSPQFCHNEQACCF